ncbi:MAG: hypothetical protein IJ683_05325 [Butyrivibrio sp.]|nr:hypothetical protein [Butyrivibrio sp.]MBR1641729.1 hypothetical protein [Butyrivibrio sp.]
MFEKMSCGRLKEDAPVDQKSINIALLANWGSWNRLVHANEYQLELGYYLIEHRNDNYDHNLVEEWQMYLQSANLDDIDDAGKLDVFKHVFLNME